MENKQELVENKQELDDALDEWRDMAIEKQKELDEIQFAQEEKIKALYSEAEVMRIDNAASDGENSPQKKNESLNPSESDQKQYENPFLVVEWDDEKATEKNFLDARVNLDRLAMKFYVDHDGDMSGFSQMADFMLSEAGMNNAEMKNRLKNSSCLYLMQTMNEDGEYVQYLGAGDSEECLKKAMKDFYANNPQLGVSERDIETMSKAAFDGISLEGPDNRNFVCTTARPFSYEPLKSENELANKEFNHRKNFAMS